MKRSRFSEEQIIGILKEHEAGVPVAELCRRHGVSDASISNWKASFDGMDVSEGRRGNSPLACRPQHGPPALLDRLADTGRVRQHVHPTTVARAALPPTALRQRPPLHPPSRAKPPPETNSELDRNWGNVNPGRRDHVPKTPIGREPTENPHRMKANASNPSSSNVVRLNNVLGNPPRD